MYFLFLVLTLIFFNILGTITPKNILIFYNYNKFHEKKISLLMWLKGFYLLKDVPFLFLELNSSNFNSNYFHLFTKSWSIAKFTENINTLLIAPLNIKVVASMSSELGMLFNISVICIFSKFSFLVAVKSLANIN